LVLASIARTFDPAGWPPVMVAAKILLQDIWKADLDWDQELLEPLKSRWARLAKDVPELVNVRISQWTGILARRELHVFADTSENAYAAAVYLRRLGPSGEWQSSLLVAKTKVAPLKLKSIPRFELCGALLAARLLQSVADGLHIEKEVRYAWSDARVVLAWIKAHPSRWATFVANRVATIQELIPEKRWRYVSTQQNPADLATRGISVDEFKDKSLWWHGPQVKVKVLVLVKVMVKVFIRSLAS